MRYRPIPHSEPPYRSFRLEGRPAAMFHELTGLAGQALGTHALRCYIDAESSTERPSEVSSFVIQAAPPEPYSESPGLRFDIRADNDGRILETTQPIRGWAQSPQGIEPEMDRRRRPHLSAQEIVDHVQTIIDAAPPLTADTSHMGEATANSSFTAQFEPRSFVPLAGKLLALAGEGVRFNRVDIALDSGLQDVGGNSEQRHTIAATGSSGDLHAAFLLEHMESAPDPRQEGPRLSFVDCRILLPYPNDRIMYAYDGLQAEDGELYRAQYAVPLDNTRERVEVSRQPYNPNDILDLARSTLDPEAYLHERWPQLFPENTI